MAFNDYNSIDYVKCDDKSLKCNYMIKMYFYASSKIRFNKIACLSN